MPNTALRTIAPSKSCASRTPFRSEPAPNLMEDRAGENTFKLAMQEAQMAVESLAKLAEVYGQS